MLSHHTTIYIIIHMFIQQRKSPCITQDGNWRSEHAIDSVVEVIPLELLAGVKKQESHSTCEKKLKAYKRYYITGQVCFLLIYFFLLLSFLICCQLSGKRAITSTFFNCDMLRLEKNKLE